MTARAGALAAAGPLLVLAAGWAAGTRGWGADRLPDAVRADGATLLGEVVGLVEEAGPRRAGTPAAAAATAWVEVRLDAAGLAHARADGDFGEARAFWRRFGRDFGSAEPDATPLRNILVEFPLPGQAAATLPGRILVLAHTDSVRDAPGAEDDASGVALALDLCRFLQRHPPARRVTVAFTDGEEIYLLGAAVLAARMSAEELAELSLAFAVEMAGWNERPYLHWFASTQTFEWMPPPPDAVLAGILGSGLPDGHSFGQVDPWVGWLFPALREHLAIPRDADHRPFDLLGRPGVMMTTSTLSGFYPWYHTREDTPDKLSASTLSRSATALRAAVHNLGRVPDLGAGSGQYGYAIAGRVIPALWLRLALLAAALGLAATLRVPGLAGAAAFLVLAFHSPPSLLGVGVAIPAAVLALAGAAATAPALRYGFAALSALPLAVTVAIYGVARATFGAGVRLNLRPVETAALAVALLACFAAAQAGRRRPRAPVADARPG